jgi:Ca-activated chloride channel family protein
MTRTTEPRRPDDATDRNATPTTVPTGRPATDPGTLEVRVDRTLVRATHHSARYVVADLVAPPAPPATDGHERPAANLALVLDRSGSMSGHKIRLAREAVRQAIERLGPRDRFSLVVYDHEVDVVMPSSLATGEARQTAIDRLARIDARANTDLGSGWLRGAEQVASFLAVEGVNRVLLLTDGLANVGITDPEELIRHAGELRARGVSTSTFGIGEDFNESLLQGMAAAGGGTFRYIERPEQIPDHLAGEVGEALEVTARDVALEVAVPLGIQVETVTPRPLEIRPGRVLVRLGDLVADQVVRVVLQLRFPLGERDREVGAIVGVVDRDGSFGAGTRALVWRYADDVTNDGQSRDREVDRVVAGVFAQRARQTAVELNREGRYEEARAALLGVARRIRDYAGHDTELRELVHQLEREADEMSIFRTEHDRKVRHAQASYALNMRMPSGAAMRHDPSRKR